MLDDLRSSAQDSYNEIETSSPQKRPVKEKTISGDDSRPAVCGSFFSIDYCGGIGNILPACNR